MPVAGTWNDENGVEANKIAMEVAAGSEAGEHWSLEPVS
jgi:hypothetical protein